MFHLCALVVGLVGFASATSEWMNELDDAALSLLQLRAQKHSEEGTDADECRACFQKHERGIIPVGVGFCPLFEKWGAKFTNVCRVGPSFGEAIEKCDRPVIANEANPTPDCDSLDPTGGGDAAGAVGDPHMTTNTGSRFDMQLIQSPSEEDPKVVKDCKFCFMEMAFSIKKGKGAGFCGLNSKCLPGTPGKSAVEECGDQGIFADAANPNPDCDSLGQAPGGDAAGAVGDPHMTTNTGSRFDMH